jgi:hypothetical protein
MIVCKKEVMKVYRWVHAKVQAYLTSESHFYVIIVSLYMECIIS